MPLTTEPSIKPGTGILRLFSLSWSIFFGVGAVIAYHRLAHATAWMWLLAGSGLFASGIFFPAAMKPVFLVVERTLKPVGEAVSTLLLAVVYFTLFTLYATIMRLTGRDSLRLKPANWGDSAWVNKKREESPHGYFGQY